MKSAFILLAGCLCLAGCGSADNTQPPEFVAGSNYAVVSTNTVSEGVPRPGAAMLFCYPDGPKGSRTLIWPFLTTTDPVTFDRLVVFNGGASAEVIWKLYPALFAYTGSGTVVEISQPACRKIPGWQLDWTNFAFAVVGITNDQLRLDASQREPVDPHQPKRMGLLLDKADILKAIATTQANTNVNVFNGVKYQVAQ